MTRLLPADRAIWFLQKSFHSNKPMHKLIENFYSDNENGKIIGMLALELQKAFDTVNYKILLDKFIHYRFSGSDLNWFRSYIENRTQMACINGSVSYTLTITTGVPQGSSFLPFTSMTCLTVFNTAQTNMYADDTAICVSARERVGVTKLMQDDLINVTDRLCANKLSLHIDKTSCMLGTSAQRRRRMFHEHLDISLNENQIEHGHHYWSKPTV